ncbi:histidine kinase [Paenibacillus sp. TRM 82003]|uniref:sensor histidine kinase n=1 Tax=Kineococcus sp. TRM81007 TaxID=2925831 RepID=UPI001F5794FB|nr:histidine kinase [Kineococcus sp. TRM81007]MCI2239398.1 histidine kinase [Kineococcus sp. TRM81007]MCI3925080.1 histidine kinase [Paenibacillus sp. TRM 82003]
MPQENVFDRIVAWPRDHVLLVDALGALALTFVCTATATATGGAAVLVSAVMCLPLALRRVRPELSGGLVAVGGLAQPVLAADPQVANVAVLIALYSLAAYAAPWASRGGLLLGLFGALVAPVRYVLPSADLVNTVAAAMFIAVLVVATWLTGRLRRASRQNELALLERARLLEVERENESRLAATAERQRIAREMHDVVAHSLSVIIAQADGGRYAAAANPAAAAEVLGTISATGRQALADMRNLLGVLRQGPGDERAPQPDAAQVVDLVAQVRASGLDVALEVLGEPRPVPPAVGLTAYRIVQESLTNVLKHAGPAARTRVQVRWDPDALRLGVDDDGRGAAALVPDPGAGGQGLLGMAERARLHGGSATAGPRAGGGFRVRATLPYAPPS